MIKKTHSVGNLKESNKRQCGYEFQVEKRSYGGRFGQKVYVSVMKPLPKGYYYYMILLSIVLNSMTLLLETQ